MTSTPDPLWMSPANPKSQPHHYTQTPSKISRGVSDHHLKLKSIIGITTATTNGFAFSKSASAFAVCAGSAAAVAQVDCESNVTWKYFRAGPATSSAHGSGSNHELPRTPAPGESRLFSSLRGKSSIKQARSPLFENAATPPDSTLTRQKTRAVTCVSMTADGEILAVGESGQNPRILMFFINACNPDVPVTILKEHTFGVRCLAFSQDMRWLCSIGDIYDGFVHLWAVNPKTGATKLHSTNKCTSFIQDVAFIGTSFISFGTRHVKLWRTRSTPPTSPSKSNFTSDQPRTLSGRNCLLGKFIESTFSCIAVVNDTTAILCTDNGQICLLEDTGRTPELRLLLQVDFNIFCATMDHETKQLIIGGPGGIGRILSFNLGNADAPTVPVFMNVRTPVSIDAPEIMAMCLLPGKLVIIESTHRIKIYDADRTNDSLNLDESAVTIPSHGNPILGVGFFSQTANQPSGFFSWSTDGSIITFSLEGVSTRQLKVPLEQLDNNSINELRVLHISQDNEHFISGDKTGILRLLEITGWNEHAYVKAHHGEISDITTVQRNEGIELVATCGRDRIIQIFQRHSSHFELLQTIEQHSSAVNEVRFHEMGRSLISSSSDRTIIIHALAFAGRSMAYLATRIITLKANPLSIAFASEDSSILIVSTGDRQLNKYDISSGHHKSSTKLVNADTPETVLLTNIAVHEVKDCGSLRPLLFGISSADRCIRVHDSKTGATVAKEYGHSQGISSIAVSRYETETVKTEFMLVTTGLDGSIMMWIFTSGVSGPEGLLGTPKLGRVQPLRRVLSHSTILEHRRTLEAEGILTLPSTPTRCRSPTRLRKKPSNYVLKSQSSKQTSSPKIETPTPRDFGNRSLSPPAIRSSCGPSPGRDHTKNANNIIEVNLLTDQLCKNLRAYRKKLSSSPSDTLNPERIEAVNQELNLTIRVMLQKTTCKSADNETAVGDLLNMYSEKLAQMVEKRIMADSAAKHQHVAEEEEQSENLDENGAISALVESVNVAHTAEANEAYASKQ